MNPNPDPENLEITFTAASGEPYERFDDKKRQSYFERLVQTGHLYILETPLFRVRPKGKKETPKAVRKSPSKKKENKSAEPEIKPNEQTYYCYSEAERDEKAAVIGNDGRCSFHSNKSNKFSLFTFHFSFFRIFAA